MATVFKKSKVILCLIFLIIFGFGAFSVNNSLAADSHEDYRSVYELGWELKYRDGSNNFKTEYRYNFKDLYNFYDSKVACHQESANCDIPDSVLIELKDDAIKSGPRSFSQNQFKIYVPPGTYRLDCNFFCKRDDIVGVAARFGSPIEGDYSNLDRDDYSNIIWPGPSSFNSLSDYTDKDVLRRNSSGAITILDGPVGGVLQKGGWFYFKLVSFQQGTQLHGISYCNGVYTYPNERINNAYLEWYDGVNWVNGDPPQNNEPPQPKQKVSLAAEPMKPVKADSEDPETDGAFKVSVQYDVTNQAKNLDGLSVDVHFDPQKVEYVDCAADSLLSGGIVSEEGNATDRYVKLRWTGGNWPGADKTLPLRLADLNFKLLEYGTTVRADIVNNIAGYGKVGYQINFTDPTSPGDNNTGGTADPSDPEYDRWKDYNPPTTTVPTYPTNPTPTNPGTGEGRWIWGIWVPAQGGSTGGSDDPATGDDPPAGDDPPSTEPGTGEGQWIYIGGTKVWRPAPNVNPGGSDDPAIGDDPSTGDDSNVDDPEAGRFDDDGDGFSPNEGDCDDADPSVYPGAPEVCDGKDNNCNGEIDEGGVCQICTDADGDGFFAEAGCGTEVDCNDNDASINPWASEICDGKDNNCNGQIDEGDVCLICTDADGDGFFAEPGCGTEVDCDDNDSSVYPGAPEICGDGIDNDCDGTVDEECASDDANTPPDQPVVMSPDGDTGLSLTPELILDKNSFFDLDGDRHVKTRWQISTQFDESHFVVNEITETQLLNWIVPSDCILEKDTQYYWRAMFFDGQDWSAPSRICMFWTGFKGVEFNENGIGKDCVIDPGEPVKLGGEFMDADGNLVTSDTIKAFKSVTNPDVQIGMIAEPGCTIEKICSQRPEDIVAEGSSFDAEIPEMPYGVIDFELTVPEKGAVANVTICFSEPLPKDFRWWKYDPKIGFYDYSVSSVSSDRKKLTLEFKDGSYGDLVEEPDGKIYDPSGFGPAAATTAPTSSGGGGGCFIRSLVF